MAVSLGLVGLWIGLACTWTQLLSLVLLVLALYLYTLQEGPIPQTNHFMLHVQLLGALVVILFFYGFIVGNRGLFLASETWVWLVFIVFAILGRYDRVWQDLQKPMLVLFYVCLALVVFGLNRPGPGAWTLSGSTSFTGEDPRYLQTIGIQLRSLLWFWPVLFATAYFQPRWSLWKFAGLLTPTVIIALQIASFKFRNEVGLALVLVTFVMVIIPLFQRKFKLLTGLVVALMLAVMSAYAVTTEGFAYFIERFHEPSKWAFRAAELNNMMDDMSGLQLLVGKGMGGDYTPPAGFGADVTLGRYARRETHIGALMPLLKGGVMLVLLYGSMFLRIILRKPPGWYDNWVNLVGLACLMTFITSQIIVPLPTMGGFLSMVIAGMGCARLGTPVYSHVWDPYGQYLEYYPTGLEHPAV